MLLLLFAAVAAVWLIGAVNLTNLQQVRAAARRRELALRTALGAGRGRVVRQLLTESGLVCLLGGAAGLAVAWAGVPALVALLPADVPRADGIRVDGVVLGFTAALSIVTALAAGTLPALRAARAGEEAARSGSRGSVGATTGRGLGVFVAVETAAAVTLVIGAALLARSLASQLAVDTGLASDRRVVAEVAPSPARHPDDAARLQFYTALERRLRALPFVSAAGLSTVFEPFGAGFGFSVFMIEGRPNPATEGGEWPSADLRTAVSAGYLNALGVPIVEGRGFTEADSSGAQRVALVSRRLADTWWPGETAVGQRIQFPGSQGDADPWRTVVGVVADVRWQGPASEEGTTLYLPLAQHVGAIDAASVIVHAGADPTLVADNLRALVASVDAQTPVSRIRAMDDVMAQAVSRPRFTTTLVLGFAALGVVLGNDRRLRGRRLRGRAALPGHRHPARPRREPRRHPRSFRRPRAGVRGRRRRHRRAGRGRPDVVARRPVARRQPVGPRHVRGRPRAVRPARGARRLRPRPPRDRARPRHGAAERIARFPRTTPTRSRCRSARSLPMATMANVSTTITGAARARRTGLPAAPATAVGRHRAPGAPTARAGAAPPPRTG